MVDYDLIGKRIQEVRKRQDMTQEQLAEAINVSTPYISYIEHAVKKPSLDVLLRTADALGVTADELLSGNQIYNPTDYQTDIDELMATCSTNEKRFVFEMVNSFVSILHSNGWLL